MVDRNSVASQSSRSRIAIYSRNRNRGLSGDYRADCLNFEGDEGRRPDQCESQPAGDMHMPKDSDEGGGPVIGSCSPACRKALLDNATEDILAKNALVT